MGVKNRKHFYLIGKPSDGIVQAFRRKATLDSKIRLQLRGLDPKASYVVKIIEAKGNKSLSQKHWNGMDLMTDGLPIEVDDKPGAAVIQYSRGKS